MRRFICTSDSVLRLMSMWHVACASFVTVWRPCHSTNAKLMFISAAQKCTRKNWPSAIDFKWSNIDKFQSFFWCAIVVVPTNIKIFNEMAQVNNSIFFPCSLQPLIFFFPFFCFLCSFCLFIGYGVNSTCQRIVNHRSVKVAKAIECKICAYTVVTSSITRHINSLDDTTLRDGECVFEVTIRCFENSRWARASAQHHTKTLTHPVDTHDSRNPYSTLLIHTHTQKWTRAFHTMQNQINGREINQKIVSMFVWKARASGSARWYQTR